MSTAAPVASPQPAPEPELSFLDPGDGRRIAIRHREADAGQPTIVFLPGYASDMAGQKALAIDPFCRIAAFFSCRDGRLGTGSRPADFAEGTLRNGSARRSRHRPRCSMSLSLPVVDGRWMRCTSPRSAKDRGVGGSCRGARLSDGFQASEKHRSRKLESSRGRPPEARRRSPPRLRRSGAATEPAQSPIEITAPVRRSRRTEDGVR